MGDERLGTLLERYLDGQLTEAERAELEQTLHSSAAARAQFWHDTRLHGLLHEAEHRHSGEDRDVISATSARSLRRWWTGLALLFVLTLALIASAWWWQHRDAMLAAPGTTATVIVGQLRDAPGAQWAAELPSPLLEAGAFELQRGIAEILLGSGSILVIQAPAKFELQTPERLILSTGKLRAEAGKTPLNIRTAAGEWTVREGAFGIAVRGAIEEIHAFTGTITQPNGQPLLHDRAVRVSSGKYEAITADPQPFPAASQSLAIPVTEGSFESLGRNEPGVPRKFGIWGGDYAASVPEEHGIKPLQGSHMLKFLRAEPLADADAPPLVASEQWQVVDLHSWRKQIGRGRVTLEFTAWFNRIADAAGTRRFGVGLFACRGGPEGAREIWKNFAELASGHAGTQILTDDDPATWERASAQLTVPVDTDYLILTVTAVRLPRRTNAPREFEGHYADDVSLTLHLPPLPAL